MCIAGCSGIILMIITNEIIFNDYQTQYRKFVWFLQFVITVTTAILLVLIVCYHYCELKFEAADKSVNHWRLGLTKRRKLLILSELLLCAIHPIPLYFPFDFDLPLFSGTSMPASQIIVCSLPSETIKYSFSNSQLIVYRFSVWTSLSNFSIYHVSFAFGTKRPIAINGMFKSGID